jgi:predicted ATP-dependent endonuclease of OLD family
MKLARVRVRTFKSIQDSNEFEIGDVTCLVGKNEAGKTALLEALYRLNPIVSEHANFDVTEDYPRSEVEEYQVDVEQGKRSHAVPITAVFTLERHELEPIEAEFRKGILTDNALTLWRQYGTEGLQYSLNIDERLAVKAIVESAGLPSHMVQGAQDQHSVSALIAFLEQQAGAQEQKRSAAEMQAAGIKDEQQKAKALDEAKTLVESEASKALRAKLAEYAKEGLPTYIWNHYIAKSLPKFLYFDEYYQMEGQVNIEKLKNRKSQGKLRDSDRPMLGLIELARLDLDQLLTPQNTQALINKLEGASNYLSQQIFKFWTQNQHISVKFDIRPGLPGDPKDMREGMNLWGFVFDSAHSVTIRLGTRSRGFIWFFSFLAWFSQQRKTNQPLILLLDEPGLFLHASAQADLLRYIEDELKPHHQVIYTSHSPFMIDPRRFERVRIVRDRNMEPKQVDVPVPEPEKGTKVLSDVLQADENSLFPLQSALAYDITQTLFIGPNTLIIEGVSDMLFIDVVSGMLQRNGRIGLSGKWTLSPVGGASKIPTFVALFRSQKGLNLATLIDIQKKDQQTIENLYRHKLLKKRQVLTFADFTKKTESDIEDMFDIGFYLDLVNNEYKTELTKPIAESDLPQHPRILARIAKYLEGNPLKTGGTVTHYRIARYFAEHIGDLIGKISDDTLNRFEEAFKALNTLVT